MLLPLRAIVRAFVLNDGSFRNCCATHPTIKSNESWNKWWYDNKEMNELREQGMVYLDIAKAFGCSHFANMPWG